MVSSLESWNKSPQGRIGLKLQEMIESAMFAVGSIRSTFMLTISSEGNIANLTWRVKQARLEVLELIYRRFNFPVGIGMVL